MSMLDRPLLTQEQRDKLDAERLDMERHNVWKVLSNNGTNGWKYPCLCSRCNRELPDPDVRELSPAETKSLDELIKMASDDDIWYTKKPDGRVKKVGHIKWFEVQGCDKDGRKWDYWLAKDQGSHRGSFMDMPGMSS